jgi:CheY-like chemotaxis protein
MVRIPPAEMRKPCLMETRILIVEDDHLQQTVLAAALVADGHVVETCSDGLDAVWRIHKGRFDVVLMDYQLPEIDGLAAALLVHDLMGETARPRLVALTAMPDGVNGRELLAERAFDEVVAKPVDLPELLAIVTRHLWSAPKRRVRKAAEFDLFMKEWGEFDAVPQRPEPDQGRPAALARVLVVEDDEVQQLVLKATLEAQGYNVDTASDGLSAVRMMREGGYDLALIDYELPEIDGLATARLVGDLLSEAARPRLVALTAKPDLLLGRAMPFRIFDAVVGKLEGLPAMIAAVGQQLRSAPDRGARCAAEAAAQQT